MKSLQTYGFQFALRVESGQLESHGDEEDEEEGEGDGDGLDRLDQPEECEAENLDERVEMHFPRGRVPHVARLWVGLDGDEQEGETVKKLRSCERSDPHVPGKVMN